MDKRYFSIFFEKLAECQLHWRQTGRWCCKQIGDLIIDTDSPMTPVSTTPVPNFLNRFYIVYAIGLLLLEKEKNT